MNKIFLSILALMFGFQGARAQMPDCLNSGGFIYLQYQANIWNWDPERAISPTNPVANTINMPPGGDGLAVSEYLGPGATYRTFYAVAGSQYRYYDGTAWVNTTHNTGNAAAVNITAGGGYIFNLAGGVGQVYRYDGTGPGVMVLNLGAMLAGPWDMAADKDGNFYLLSLTLPQWLRKYDPNGTLIQQYPLVNATTNYNYGGGLAVFCDSVYFTNIDGVYSGVIRNDSVFFNSTALSPTSAPYYEDIASCESGSQTVAVGADTSFYLYRGCFGADIKFQIKSRQDTVKLKLNLLGNAQNGLDYGRLDTQMVFNPGDTLQYLEIIPLLRRPSVGDRNLKIEVLSPNPCNLAEYKVVRTIDVLIKDSLEVAIITPPVTVCPGDTITMTATKDPILDHFWEPANLIYGTGLTVKAKPSTTTRYSVRVEYPGAPATCPPRTKYYTATVEPYPAIRVPDDFIVCLTDSITFDVGVTPNNPKYDVTWIPANGFGNPKDMNSKFFDNPGTYTKILRVTTPIAKCSREEEFTVTIMPPFKITELSNDTIIYYGDSIRLTAKGENAYIWVWNPTRTIKDYSNETITVWPKESTVYTAIVFDEYGCKDSGQVKVQVLYQPKLMMPNAFTPNGDGLNDIFKIEGIQYEKLNSFQVFDRYGTKVFETTNINKGWDGTYLGGEKAAAGVYYYLIEMSNVDRQTFQFKGDITLIR